jgi:L-2-amino-thiazoline-4-carboxylic acid hydrolase
MPDSTFDYIPDPASEAEWAITAFLDALAAESTTAPAIGQLRNQLAADFAQQSEQYRDWLTDEAARHALRQGAAVLSAYRLFGEIVPKPTLLRILQSCFVEPLREAVRSATAHALDNAPDPFAEIVGIAKLRERSVFGGGFQFEKRRDDDAACYLDVVRCLWHRFFVAEGCPELTAIFCAFDHNWIDAIDPARHGVSFERAVTLGTGGALCPFHFFRVRRST